MNKDDYIRCQHCQHPIPKSRINGAPSEWTKTTDLRFIERDGTMVLQQRHYVDNIIEERQYQGYKSKTTSIEKQRIEQWFDVPSEVTS